MLTNTEVLNCVKGSDQKMVRVTVKLSLPKRKQLFKPKFKSATINKENLLEFQNNVCAATDLVVLKSDQKLTEIEQMYNTIISLIVQTTLKYLKTQEQKEPKLTQNTLKLMEKRRTLNPTSTRDKVEEAELNKLIKRQQRQDIRNHNVKTIEEAIKQGKGFKQAQQKVCLGKQMIPCIKEENGNVTTIQNRIPK